MRSFTKTLLLTGLLCVVLTISACSSGKGGTGAAQAGPAAAGAGSVGGLPARVLVFTYNADCCEATRQFFDLHRDSVQVLEKKYGNVVEFKWYDVANRDEVYQKELLEAAKKAEVTNIPAFVVLDHSGNVLSKQIGQLKEDEVNKVFEGLNR